MIVGPRPLILVDVAKLHNDGMPWSIETRSCSHGCEMHFCTTSRLERGRKRARVPALPAVPSSAFGDLGTVAFFHNDRTARSAHGLRLL